MARHSKAQKDTVGRVMHEFKHGELKSGSGRKVKNPKQAVAIALNEAGASKNESKQENARNLRKTKSKERKGQTGKDAAEGKAGGRTKADLYAEAKKRNISGRSKMSKDQLSRALRG